MSSQSKYPEFEKISPDKVRYIKLGNSSDKYEWEPECRKKRTIRISFGSGEKKKFNLCEQGQWEELEKELAKDNKSPKDATNQLKAFFEDDGSTLWITIMDHRLYWGMLEKIPPKQYGDGRSVYRSVVDGWRCINRAGEELRKSDLSGAIKRYEGRRTSSALKPKHAQRVIRLINDEEIPEVKRAREILNEIKLLLPEAMEELDATDFELLADLVFTTSGWQRQSIVGGTQETADTEIILPSTGERAFLQAKFETNSAEFNEYIEDLRNGPWSRMFYVYHTCRDKIPENIPLPNGKSVTLINSGKLSDMVINAGLINWLIKRSR